MSSIHFYHLTTTPLERALPKLLEKCYASGARTRLVVGDEARVDHLNNFLWTYDQDSFLPHGSARDGHEEAHPILLTSGLPDAANDEILFITSGDEIASPAGFSRVIDMFDGSHDEALLRARARWKRYKEAGFELSYWKQKENGGWEKQG